MINRLKLIKSATTCLGCWTLLGFYRGVKYHYHHNKEYVSQTYSSSIINGSKMIGYGTLYGLSGMIIYANPLFFPNNISKEIYRLKICANGLDNEKNQNNYNSIL
jgi:hypothetical protein